MYDVLRADRCISVNSLEARVPFGDLDFVKYVMALDPELKLNTYGKGKYLLRHAFEQGGYLPDTILWREKAAFSDAVGHSMVDYIRMKNLKADVNVIRMPVLLQKSHYYTGRFLKLSIRDRQRW